MKFGTITYPFWRRLSKLFLDSRGGDANVADGSAMVDLDKIFARLVAYARPNQAPGPLKL
jgi:hypothetical protein